MIETFQDSYEEIPCVPLDQPLALHVRAACFNHRALILFVHGLGGSRYRTWGQLPSLLFDDMPRCDLGLYSYRNAWRRLKFWRSVEMETEAHTLARPHPKTL